ncbi:guanine deaminase [Congregibacter variabilis]|uniref:Guanine deaminase n=1 Tax=Congregibacter variabilis TaxID=3081200 RepID=A0ABZ0I4M2_9GAMM|nr:guanine deaminase [Congregibacter sp. IMCC43200]
MSRVLHRGSLLHFLDDPQKGLKESYQYFIDGALLVENGHVTAIGDAQQLIESLPSDTQIQEHKNALLVPGFVDTHIHYPQMDIIGAHGEQLLEWLDTYVFPVEAKFADIEYAQQVARRFLKELLRNGTTTALVFGTVHPQSVDAFFSEAQSLNLRMIAGKVMMDRNAPDNLKDTAESSYRDSKALIQRWHDRGRLRYAVTPRFAPTSTPEQLKAAGQLLREHPGVYLHTHMSENLNEVAWVEELFPHLDHYLHSYDDAGLLGRRSVFAHCVHLSEVEWQRMAETQSNIAFCPTSNLFLGSGLFPLAKAESCGVNVGLGTDIGAGTSFSLLETMDAAYKVQQLQGHSLTPFKSFYLATLGGARTLDLESKIGNFIPGKEADFLVLDLAATPLLEQRMQHCEDLFETLFVLSTLGDDRCIRESWIMGECKHRRDDSALSEPQPAHTHDQSDGSQSAATGTK